MPIAPPGHKVVVIKPSPKPFFASAASGPMVLNFGAPQFIPGGLNALRTFVATVTDPQSVIWLMPASIFPAFSDEPRLLEQAASLVAAAPLVSHLAIFPDDSALLDQAMSAFRRVGVSAQRGAPDGACYVEVHKPDGTIVVGIPGPDLTPEEPTR